MDECVRLGFLDPAWKGELSTRFDTLTTRSVYQEDHVLALEKVQLQYVAELQARIAAEQCAATLEEEFAAATRAHEETMGQCRFSHNPP